VELSTDTIRFKGGKTEHATVLKLIRISSSLCVYYEVECNVLYSFLICCNRCSVVLLLI